MDLSCKVLLLVEDEPLIRLAEVQTLEAAGCMVIQASSGEKALALVEENPAIDLILMDIDLGAGMDGTEAARKILTTHDIPILFLSSHTEKEVVDKTEAITSYGYVVKNSGDLILLTSIAMALKLSKAVKEMKAKEKSLRESEEKFSLAFYLSPDSVNINRLSDGVYIDINKGFTEIMGFTREDVIGHSSLPGDLSIWVNAADREKLVQGLKTRGEVVNLEALFRKKDGTENYGLMSARVIDINGEKCILSFTRDIHSQKMLELALKESETRFRNLIEHAPDAILLGSPGGIIIEANSQACSMTGYSRDGLIGQPISILFTPQEVSRVPLRYDLLKAGKAVISERYLLRADGSQLPVEMHTKMMPDQTYQTFIRDVSHRAEPC